MENQQPWKLRVLCSFRNATILITLFNLFTLSLLLHRFLGSSNRRIPQNQPDPVQLRYIMEAEAIRRTMEPLELIKRVREIQQEGYREPEMVVQRQAPKKTAAADLSKRLQDLRALNDANSKKALEEWRKRKKDRERQREMEKNRTINASQA
ncbi:hypothetical protein MRB53_036168 [Persea americana]|uniref:Uncharacterized protein n=1 Tax=Persea americana TaxID=3435 RepID=A0ACC2K6T3_PERAE|nr:hypothetical protein MRB53_036168 [Persea americana]